MNSRFACFLCACTFVVISTAVCADRLRPRSAVAGTSQVRGSVQQASHSPAGPICPVFIINARSDKFTLALRCVDLYARLLETGVNAELHVFGKGAHGFDLGVGRGESVAVWPRLFVAWLQDLGLMK